MKIPKIGFKTLHSNNGAGSIVHCKWDGQGKRKPKKGEYFISGCPGYESAYKAFNDLDTEYFIAKVIDVKPICKF